MNALSLTTFFSALTMVLANTGVDLQVSISLIKSEATINCGRALVEEFGQDVQVWLQDEFEQTLGEDVFHVPTFHVTQTPSRIHATAVIHSKSKLHPNAIAKPLQWGTQAVVDEWIQDNKHFLNSCLSDSMTADLQIQEVPTSSFRKLTVSRRVEYEKVVFSQRQAIPSLQWKTRA